MALCISGIVASTTSKRSSPVSGDVQDPRNTPSAAALRRTLGKFLDMIMGQLLHNWVSTGFVRWPVVSISPDDDRRAKRLR
jgi:hypothetical protein